MKTIGARVTYARKARQWSQAELARRVGVKPQAIQQIESNRTKHSRYLPDIARVSGVELGWLLTGIGPIGGSENASTVEVEPVSLQKLQRLVRQVTDAVAAGQLDADTLDLLERLLDKLTRANLQGKR